MPGGDRTGPWGGGPLSGRGLGYCAGYEVPGFQQMGAGRWPRHGFGGGRRGMAYRHGVGWGCGFGFGAGRGYPPAVTALPIPAAAPTADRELAALRARAAGLQEELSAIQRRLQELDREGA